MILKIAQKPKYDMMKNLVIETSIFLKVCTRSSENYGVRASHHGKETPESQFVCPNFRNITVIMTKLRTRLNCFTKCFFFPYYFY